jgi:hypothetical protein
MKRRTFLRFGTGAALTGALAACGGGDENAGSIPVANDGSQGMLTQSKSVVVWNQTALQAVRVTKPGPPMVARSLAVIHTAMYEAWSAYDRVALGTQLGNSLRRPIGEHTAQNKVRAMSFAAYAALLDQFPAQKAAFDAQMTALGFNPSDASTNDTAKPEGIGTVAASAVLKFCHDDGANQMGTLTPSGLPYADYTGYKPKNDPAIVSQPTPLSGIAAPGNWQPLTYTDATGATKTPGYLAACWDRVKPFAMTSPSQFRPSPETLAMPGTAEYLAQAQRVVDTQINLTEKQKVIAEYWADGPASELPPGHWCLFAQFVSDRDLHDDDQDVKMFFALSNAVFDAGIAAWDAKKIYDSERPITAIRFLMNGDTITGYGPNGPAGGLVPITGAAWIPFQPNTFPTPPFPEHVSGHSTFSAASAEVLKQFTGSDAFGGSYTKKAKSMAIDPALPSQDLMLQWATFSDAAAEAGMSRIYGGIHFDNANDAGLALGRKIGAQTFAKAKIHWDGVA